MSKLTLGAGVHKLVPKLFRAEVTRAEHRLPHWRLTKTKFEYGFDHVTSILQTFDFDPTAIFRIKIEIQAIWSHVVVSLESCDRYSRLPKNLVLSLTDFESELLKWPIMTVGPACEYLYHIKIRN